MKNRNSPKPRSSLPSSSPRLESKLKKSVGRWAYRMRHFTTEKKYGGLGITELRKMWQLEEENHQLQKLVGYTRIVCKSTVIKADSIQLASKGYSVDPLIL